MIFILIPLCYLQPNHIFHFLIKKKKRKILKESWFRKLSLIREYEWSFTLLNHNNRFLNWYYNEIHAYHWWEGDCFLCTLQQCTCVNGFKSWPYSRIERGELKFHLGFESSIGQKSTKALPKSLNTEIGYMIYIKCMQLISVLRNKKL